MARKNQEMEVVLLSVEGRDQDDVHLKTWRHEHMAVQMAEMVCMQMVRSCMEYVDAFTASQYAESNWLFSSPCIIPRVLKH